MSIEYGAIIGGVSGGVIALIGYICVTRWLNKKNEERETQKESRERLFTHFKEIQLEVQSNISTFMSSLSLTNGKIGVTHKHGHQGSIDSLPSLSRIFNSHFSSEAQKYEQYASMMKIHNDKCNRFYENLDEIIKKSGIILLAGNISKAPSPCIFDSIYYPLFDWWRSRETGNIPSYNFENLKYEEDKVYVSGYHSAAIAYAQNIVDLEKCKKTVHTIALNSNLQKEGATLIKEGREIVNEINQYKEWLTKRLADIEKLNLKIRDYEFKIENECPRCDEIFGKSKVKNGR